MTPTNGSTETLDNIYVNISSEDENDHYAFVDFEDTLLMWMRMDDVNGSSDPVDIVGYDNNGKVRCISKRATIVNAMLQKFDSKNSDKTSIQKPEYRSQRTGCHELHSARVIRP